MISSLDNRTADRPCAVCGQYVAALTPSGRCADCRRAEVQRNKARRAVEKKRARRKGRVA